MTDERKVAPKGREAAAKVAAAEDAVLSAELAAFRARVAERGEALYRDLPWRRTHDAYAIWISEVMLQQTQVSRVDGRWQHWLERFPSVDVLASAATADVLAEWQGLGYNRRALSVLRAAQTVSNEWGGKLPREVADLQSLPGIGPATAAGIRAFAYDLPGVYLETNVRAVFMHELFPDAAGVPDRELAKLVAVTCPTGGAATPATSTEPTVANILTSPRLWYYALLDYGFELKRTGHNAARRSAAGAQRQSRFEGSFRQKRAEVVRILLASPEGLQQEAIQEALNEVEEAAGREPVPPATLGEILSALAREGFCRQDQNSGLWLIA